jgi:hypothetical protein
MRVKKVRKQGRNGAATAVSVDVESSRVSPDAVGVLFIGHAKQRPL